MSFCSPGHPHDEHDQALEELGNWLELGLRQLRLRKVEAELLEALSELLVLQDGEAVRRHGCARRQLRPLPATGATSARAPARCRAQLSSCEVKTSRWRAALTD